LVVATPFGMRRGEKGDFNDTIRLGGLAAVRVRIEAALNPGGGNKPPIWLSASEARQILELAVDQFITAAIDYYDALKRAETDAIAAEEARSELTLPLEVIKARRARFAARSATRAAAELRARKRVAPRGWARAKARQEAQVAATFAAVMRADASEVDPEIRTGG
jgi:creatinine amidohydrolase/Fe(II)-dependent formamide hydrolase-like protein